MDNQLKPNPEHKYFYNCDMLTIENLYQWAISVHGHANIRIVTRTRPHSDITAIVDDGDKIVLYCL